MAKSYGMWGWKIGESVMPRPVAAWMFRRRKTKRKRQKARAKQKEMRRAVRHSRRPARI
jgi:aspartate/methionine/tyrosine aminotransferase